MEKKTKNTTHAYSTHIVLYLFSNRYGSWAVCFTYGAWFGAKGLIAAGRTFENSPAIRKACDFLLSKELPSGGWGESYLSSQDKVNSFLEFHKSTMLPTIPVLR